ncbi:MAG TPA: glucose-6-phosphate dehydrogenase [Aliidongia sp.]|nr:glucose-6-phosphate dehydrogenase [Aliidongia sp.]
MAAEQQSQERSESAPPCAMVIFGASGDLTKRLLVPALYNLKRTGLLPEQFYLLGVDRMERDVEEFRKDLAGAVDSFARNRSTESGQLDSVAWDGLAGAIDYLAADFGDAKTFEIIAERLERAAREHGTEGNALFYLAVADRFFAPLVGKLGEAGLTREGDDGKGWRRVIIEKPFGHDYASAHALNSSILETLDETQIYRIDHYLGKETVQNIMVFRFANGIFEPLWNRDHIDHIQITVAETVGVEQRGGFYDRAGALRDMVPNHLFQLLSMTAMEPPNNFSADAVRTEKVKALGAAHLADGGDPRLSGVRGQYAAGAAAGRSYRAYREEPNVAPTSTTETFVAMKLNIDNWRWAGMPFYLRTGKALKRRASEIVVQFKRAPFSLFRDTPVDRMTANRLTLQIQPEEGIAMEFGAKIPGPRVSLGRVSMNFQYKDYFEVAPSTGYETLVYDCMIGDATLFQRADSVEAGWSVVQPLIDLWTAEPNFNLQTYEAGSAGPQNADELLARDGRVWRTLV